MKQIFRALKCKIIQYDAEMSCAYLQLSPHSQILRKQTLHKLWWPWSHWQSLTSTLLALTRHHVWDLQATFIRLHICSLTISVLTAECFDLGFFQGSSFFLLKFVRINMKRLIWVTFGVYVFRGDSSCIVSCSFPKSDIKRNLTFEVYIWYETPIYDLKLYDIKATPHNSNLDNVCSASKWGRHEDYRWRLKCFDGKYFQDSPVCRVETIIVGIFNFFDFHHTAIRDGLYKSE